VIEMSGTAISFLHLFIKPFIHSFIHSLTHLSILGARWNLLSRERDDRVDSNAKQNLEKKKKKQLKRKKMLQTR